eukprot:TRINITY_DN2755_c0_g1_i1.p1 TRINITY_DN2755_c0_g1~~TRINITY_DN2755_c0_g1_i1.p1  ORF type:complete len:445 (-),score=94.63 TRINITY_DN2755_c0_g1_i1:25-1359(-)
MSQDEEPVKLSIKELTAMMIHDQKELVMKYLKTLPKKESKRVTDRLLRNLHTIKQAQMGGGSVNGHAKLKKHSSEGYGKKKRVPLDEIASNHSITEDFDFGEIVLGRGAFSTVYKGFRKRDSHEVAVKRMDKEVLDPESLVKAMREAEILKSLTHPHIVGFEGYYETSRYVYFVLEFVGNGSLYDLMKSHGLFPLNIVVIYIRQLLEGLAYVHSFNIVHRDIKSDNILIASDGNVRLADFGTAKSTDVKGSFTVIGTPYWMAPEIIEMSGGGVKSDVWSVGCTVIELITGNPPYFEMKKMSALFKIVQDDHPPLPENISPELQHFLLRCFVKDIEGRPSCGELLGHPWVQKAEGQSPPTSFADLNNQISQHNLYDGNVTDSEVIEKLQSELESKIDERDELLKKIRNLEKKMSRTDHSIDKMKKKITHRKLSDDGLQVKQSHHA